MNNNKKVTQVSSHSHGVLENSSHGEVDIEYQLKSQFSFFSSLYSFSLRSRKQRDSIIAINFLLPLLLSSSPLRQPHSTIETFFLSLALSLSLSLRASTCLVKPLTSRRLCDNINILGDIEIALLESVKWSPIKQEPVSLFFSFRLASLFFSFFLSLSFFAVWTAASR